MTVGRIPRMTTKVILQKAVSRGRLAVLCGALMLLWKGEEEGEGAAMEGGRGKGKVLLYS